MPKEKTESETKICGRGISDVKQEATNIQQKY